MGTGNGPAARLEPNVMITRRVFIGASAAVLLGWQRDSAAQQVPRVPRVGVLVGAASPHPFADAFRRGLQTLGYQEGQNIALEIRYTGGQADRAAELAAELVRLRVDVIVTHFTQTTRAALAATRTIPIVMVVGAPVESGFVASLARPGGNATGLSGMDAEIAGKRLQILHELNPRLERVAILGTTPTTNPYSGPYVEDLRRAASSTDLRLVPVLISGPDEFGRAFSEMAKAGVQAVIVQDHFDPYRSVLVELAAKHKLAYMSGTKGTAAAGALVSLSPDWSGLFQRAAVYVDRILKGAKPETLPVEQATKFQLVLNLKTAKALGLKVPASLLAQADEVIE
jgi:putative ABC transport system substrate-binding protein